MVLTRTGSAKSTLSMMQRRATRYQKYLTMASVFLTITSTIVIFSSVVLLKFYYLKNLHFWSIYFYVTPILMICLGVFKFITSLYGFAISNTENRALLGTFAVLLVVAFLGQLASIFTAIEVRTTITVAEYGGTNVVQSLEKYGEDSAVTAEWDTMQVEQRCCGGTNFLTGYMDYRNTPIGQQNHSVPDSCCHEMVEGCGRNMFHKTPEQIENSIWLVGCLTALKYRLTNDVSAMMAVYAGVGVLIALVELIAVVLTSAYMAQINRRRQREEMMWNSVRNADDIDHTEAARALNPSVEHETVC